MGPIEACWEKRMIKRVKLAKINLTMQSGRILRWLKKEGDPVERDEPLLEVETDKAVNTVESFHSGYLRKILVAEGEEVPVNTLIAYIGDPGDEVPAEPPPDGPDSVPGAESKPPRAAGGAAVARGRGVNASPLARRLAAELGVDLATVTGTGPDGRIGKEDVVAAAQGRDSGGHDVRSSVGNRFVPLAGLKKTTAERMKGSYLEAPHIHLDVSVNVGPLEALRARLNAGTSGAGNEGRYTLTDLIARAVSLALISHPLLNGAFQDAGIVLFSAQGIGLAVSSPAGLVVPVIRDCQALNLRQIRDRRRELVGRARAGRQTAEDLTGGSFTITNLGMLGVDAFRPILYPGQAAILAVGAIRQVVVADTTGGFSAQPMVQLTLGCDHRVVDGAEGAAFLRQLRELLESPGELTSGEED